MKVFVAFIFISAFHFCLGILFLKHNFEKYGIKYVLYVAFDIQTNRKNQHTTGNSKIYFYWCIV